MSAQTIVQEAWLLRLRSAVPVACLGRDPEGVHELRVAAGRLDVWMRLSGLRVLRGDLRWLRARASSVRDLDVLLERELSPTLRRRIARLRGARRRELLAALEDRRLAGLLFALELLPPPSVAAAAPRLVRLARRVLARGEELAGRPEDIQRLHGLRRAVRRLRYALEWLGRDAEALREVQGALGRLNDTAVALAVLDGSPAEMVAALQAEQTAARAAALEAWTRAAGGVATLVPAPAVGAR